MAKKVNRLNDANNTPVGAILQSRLTEAQFQAINGTSWVLMDGRSIVGSKLADITGITNLDDARGLILRGKNNGRSDGAQNPDGDLAIGTYQSDNINVSVAGVNAAGNHIAAGIQ